MVVQNHALYSIEYGKQVMAWKLNRLGFKSHLQMTICKFFPVKGEESRFVTQIKKNP